ncbi:MAG: peptide deformylase [Myxococcales bacterium]|nr:peptide deformylase [Myxococcales bacterium]
MAIRRVVTYPEEVLVTKALPVTGMDSDIVRLMDDMAETMYVSNGIGLAAPQVGVSLRVLTMDVVPEKKNGKSQLIQIANPVIVEGHGHVVYEEGCLSFPGISAPVSRLSQIYVKAIGRDGNEFVFEADGLAAICLQHEIDHLEGITFIDRLTGLQRRLALREYVKARREENPNYDAAIVR